MTLTDCHPDTMEALLQFCYTGECRRPKRDMLGLLVMADRLDMPCLTAICEKVRPPRHGCCCLKSRGQAHRLRVLEPAAPQLPGQEFIRAGCSAAEARPLERTSMLLCEAKRLPEGCCDAGGARQHQ